MKTKGWIFWQHVDFMGFAKREVGEKVGVEVGMRLGLRSMDNG